MRKEFLECGKIIGAHGVRGLVKVESWCDTPKVLAAQKRVFFAEKDGTYKEATVLTASVSGPLVLMSLATVADRECAQGLKNTVLYLNRHDIPKRAGAHFLQDLIGIPVIDAQTGKVYGKVKDITDAVRSRLYVIETEGGEVLLPDVKEFIKDIDEERGIFITPIPGFFD